MRKQPLQGCVNASVNSDLKRNEKAFSCLSERVAALRAPVTRSNCECDSVRQLKFWAPQQIGMTSQYLGKD